MCEIRRYRGLQACSPDSRIGVNHSSAFRNLGNALQCFEKIPRRMRRYLGEDCLDTLACEALKRQIAEAFTEPLKIKTLIALCSMGMISEVDRIIIGDDRGTTEPASVRPAPISTGGALAPARAAL
jgi:hypothetical protein